MRATIVALLFILLVLSMTPPAYGEVLAPKQVKTSCSLSNPLFFTESYTVTSPSYGVFKVVDNFYLNGTVYTITVTSHTYTILNYKVKGYYIIAYGGINTPDGERPVFMVIKYPEMRVISSGALPITGHFLYGDYDLQSNVFVGVYTTQTTLNTYLVNLAYIDTANHIAKLISVSYPSLILVTDVSYISGKAVVVGVSGGSLIITGIDVNNPTNVLHLRGTNVQASDAKAVNYNSFLYILETTNNGDQVVRKFDSNLNELYSVGARIYDPTSVMYYWINDTVIYFNGIVFRDTGASLLIEQVLSSFSTNPVIHYATYGYIYAIYYATSVRFTIEQPYPGYPFYSSYIPEPLSPDVAPTVTITRDDYLYINEQDLIIYNLVYYSSRASICDYVGTELMAADVFVSNYRLINKEYRGYIAEPLPLVRDILQLQTFDEIFPLMYDPFYGSSIVADLADNTGTALNVKLGNIALYNNYLTITTTSDIIIVNRATGDQIILTSPSSGIRIASTAASKADIQPNQITGSSALSLTGAVYFEGKLLASDQNGIYLIEKNITTGLWDNLGYYNVSVLLGGATSVYPNFAIFTVGNEIFAILMLYDLNTGSESFYLLKYDNTTNSFIARHVFTSPTRYAGVYPTQNYFYFYYYDGVNTLVVAKYDTNLNLVASMAITGFVLPAILKVTASDTSFFITNATNILELDSNLQPVREYYTGGPYIAGIAYLNNTLHIAAVSQETQGYTIYLLDVNKLVELQQIQTRTPTYQATQVTITPSQPVEVPFVYSPYYEVLTETIFASYTLVSFYPYYVGNYIPEEVTVQIGACRPTGVISSGYPLTLKSTANTVYLAADPTNCAYISPTDATFIINGTTIVSGINASVPVKGLVTFVGQVLGVDGPNNITYGVVIEPVGFFTSEKIVSYTSYSNLTYVFTTENPAYVTVIVSDAFTYKILKDGTLLCENCGIKTQYWIEDSKLFAFDPSTTTVILNTTVYSVPGITPLILAPSVAAGAARTLGGGADAIIPYYLIPAVMAIGVLVYILIWVKRWG